MATVGETIRQLREKAGITPQEMANRLWMNVPSYYDLESVTEEWEEAVELGQLLELSKVLGIPLLEMLGETKGNLPSPLSFPQLAALLHQRIDSGQVVEDEMGWDMAEFWEEPRIGLEYPVSFLKIVAEDAGFDWRQPILFYQGSAKFDAPPNAGSGGAPSASAG